MRKKVRVEVEAGFLDGLAADRGGGGGFGARIAVLEE